VTSSDSLNVPKECVEMGWMEWKKERKKTKQKTTKKQKQQKPETMLINC